MNWELRISLGGKIAQRRKIFSLHHYAAFHVAVLPLFINSLDCAKFNEHRRSVTQMEESSRNGIFIQNDSYRFDSRCEILHQSNRRKTYIAGADPASRYLLQQDNKSLQIIAHSLDNKGLRAIFMFNNVPIFMINFQNFINKFSRPRVSFLGLVISFLGPRVSSARPRTYLREVRTSFPKVRTRNLESRHEDSKSTHEFFKVDAGYSGVRMSFPRVCTSFQKVHTRSWKTRTSFPRVRTRSQNTNHESQKTKTRSEFLK